MLKDQCISVTDLRKKTKQCLSDVHQYPKYIFANNKFIAVIMDVDHYERLFYETDLRELDSSDVSPVLFKKASRARKLNSKDLMDL